MDKEEVGKVIFSDLEVKGLSFTTKIFLLSRFFELRIRYVDEIPDETVMNLNKNALFKLKNKEYPFFEESEGVFKGKYLNFCQLRNLCVHTQNRHIATENEFVCAYDDALYIYAWAFYRFFSKHGFGTGKDEHILSAFSILPPVIRRIALEQLNKKYPNNKFVIEKYVWALLKNEEKEEARQFLAYNNKIFLENHEQELLLKLFELLDSVELNNLLCSREGQKMKESFPWYKEYHDILSDKDNEEKQFKELLDFVYSMIGNSN